MKRITIEPVTRIEGHAKITIQLDDQGHVAGTEFHVTQVRGFEKFTEGRPFYEMPGITAPRGACRRPPESCGNWCILRRSCNLMP